MIIVFPQGPPQRSNAQGTSNKTKRTCVDLTRPGPLARRISEEEIDDEGVLEKEADNQAQTDVNDFLSGFKCPVSIEQARIASGYKT